MGVNFPSDSSDSIEPSETQSANLSPLKEASVQNGEVSEILADRHPFGGCNKLLGQYAIIGRELLRYERCTRKYGYVSFSAFSNFREGVSFVSNEVLSSYLEDLLDLDIPEPTLFISRDRVYKSANILVALGLSGALSIGLYAASAGASLPLSFALTVCLAMPFGVLWHLSPKDDLTRRMGFAQIISHEISRRRGSDRGASVPLGPNIIFGDLLSHSAAGSAQSAAFSPLGAVPGPVSPFGVMAQRKFKSFTRTLH